MMSILMADGENSIGSIHVRDMDGDGKVDASGSDWVLSDTETIVPGEMIASPIAINVDGDSVLPDVAPIANLMKSHAASGNENVKVFHVLRYMVVVMTMDVSSVVMDGVMATPINGIHTIHGTGTGKVTIPCGVMDDPRDRATNGSGKSSTSSAKNLNVTAIVPITKNG